MKELPEIPQYQLAFMSYLTYQSHRYLDAEFSVHIRFHSILIEKVQVSAEFYSYLNDAEPLFYPFLEGGKRFGLKVFFIKVGFVRIRAYQAYLSLMNIQSFSEHFHRYVHVEQGEYQAYIEYTKTI